MCSSREDREDLRESREHARNNDYALSIKLDPAQFEAILSFLRGTDESHKLQALTDKLKASEEALSRVVAQNQP